MRLLTIGMLALSGIALLSIANAYFTGSVIVLCIITFALLLLFLFAINERTIYILMFLTSLIVGATAYAYTDRILLFQGGWSFKFGAFISIVMLIASYRYWRGAKLVTANQRRLIRGLGYMRTIRAMDREILIPMLEWPIATLPCDKRHLSLVLGPFSTRPRANPYGLMSYPVKQISFTIEYAYILDNLSGYYQIPSQGATRREAIGKLAEDVGSRPEFNPEYWHNLSDIQLTRDLNQVIGRMITQSGLSPTELALDLEGFECQLQNLLQEQLDNYGLQLNLLQIDRIDSDEQLIRIHSIEQELQAKARAFAIEEQGKAVARSRGEIVREVGAAGSQVLERLPQRLTERALESSRPMVNPAWHSSSEFDPLVGGDTVQVDRIAPKYSNN